jgi:radical SAM superfamily enzyme YgiQ (UPF0313 family)
MKVYLIKASAGSDFSKYKAETAGPPQNIFSTAAATPTGVDIEMCDETIGMKTNFKSKADIVAIFMSTPDAIRAYEIADRFRKLNKCVVLGGLHTKFCPEEASEHADTLLLGEVEGIWEDLINDFRSGNLKAKYERSIPVDLADLKPYPTDIIPLSRYNYTWSVLISRGCVHKCDFCLVHKFSGKYRFRPIADIVSEISNLKKLGVQWVELHSDTLTANRSYIIELFNALAPLKMNFYGETTIMIAKDTDLLKAAQKAGVKALLFGIETPSETALMEQGKGFVKPEEIKEYIKIVKSYGIKVWGDFLVGFDDHGKEIFNQTWEFIKDIKVDRFFNHLVIPFPGSETYQKLDQEGRILTKDWSCYDGGHVVYKPSKLTEEELITGLDWLWEKEIYGTGGKDPFTRKKGFWGLLGLW